MTAATSFEPAAVPTGDRDKAASSCARVADQDGDTPLVFAARLNLALVFMNKGDPSPAGGKSGRTPAGEEFHAGRPAVTKRGKNGAFSEDKKAMPYPQKAEGALFAPKIRLPGRCCGAVQAAFGGSRMCLFRMGGA